MVNPWLIMVNNWNNNISGWWFGVWNFFSIQLGIIIIPTDQFIFFRGVGQPPTSYDMMIPSISQKLKSPDLFGLL
jgi:hypothetical protein